LDLGFRGLDTADMTFLPGARFIDSLKKKSIGVFTAFSFWAFFGQENHRYKKYMLFV
jgi:hypothetical protein